jgi:hypothetical protein
MGAARSFDLASKWIPKGAKIIGWYGPGTHLNIAL